MALQPGIILGGQGVNALGAIAAGNEAAARQKEFQRTQDYNAMLQQNGAGIIGGDMNALNALAAYDPMAALNVQATKQDMGYRAKQMEVLDLQEQRAAQEYAAKLTADQRAAEVAQIEEAVKMGMMAQTPEQFDAIMSQIAPEMVGQFENRQMLAAKAMSIAEVFKMAFPEPPSASDRFKVVGGSLFDLQAEGGPAVVGQGAMQETMVMGPDGKPIMVQGGPGTTAKFTEGQSKDNVYATRAEGALAKLEPVADSLTDRSGVIGDALGGVTLGLSREMLQTDAYQVARNAGDEFLQAILRKDTGAAITAQEQEIYGKTFLPQPGDGEAVLQAKREARVRAVEAIRAGMNAQQLEAVARAEASAIARLGGTSPGAQGASGGPQSGPVVIDGFTIEAIE